LEATSSAQKMGKELVPEMLENCQTLKRLSARNVTVLEVSLWVSAASP